MVAVVVAAAVGCLLGRLVRMRAAAAAAGMHLLR
jgi:hypothetical protein